MTTKFSSRTNVQKPPAVCFCHEHYNPIPLPGPSCPDPIPGSLMCCLDAEAATVIGHFHANFAILMREEAPNTYGGAIGQWVQIGGLWWQVTASAGLIWSLGTCIMQCANLITVPFHGQLFATGWTDVYNQRSPFYYDGGRKGSSLGNGFGTTIWRL